jgi:polyphosphate glucokinase
MQPETGPFTLDVDCGGSGLKACILDAAGSMVSERVRVPTPYPCPPELFVATIRSLAEQLPPYDRVSVGVPGLIRGGVVYATPHYVTENGPFTPRRPDLVAAWDHWDVRAALEKTLSIPTRVVNDAELQGLAVVSGKGYEIMLTLGTGLGFAHFDEGRLLPKVEMSQHPFRKGTYDERLGNLARKAAGNGKWARRVVTAVDTLRPVLWWDHLYLGGGNSKHLTEDVFAALGPTVTVVPNSAGLLGGVRLWDPGVHVVLPPMSDPIATLD